MTTPGIALLILRLLLAGVLYGFLGLLAWLIWQDVRRHQGAATLSPRQTASLFRLDSDDIFPLEVITSIGRALSSTIQVSDNTVSNEHALITFREGYWWLEDLRSRNGTTLNGQLITSPAILMSGDLIGIGDELFRIELEQAPREKL